jgi:uncharacterized Zn finger protein
MSREQNARADEVFEGFRVICKQCGSEDVELEDNRGYSDWTGAWGSVKMRCNGCGYTNNLVDA